MADLLHADYGKTLKGALGSMKYASAYRKPDHDDLGYLDISSYIIINSVGYYNIDEAYGATHRKSGRRDFYLSYNDGGNMKLRISGKERLIGEGDVFLYHPHQEQYYGQANNEPISNYWVHFTGYGAFEQLAHSNMPEQGVYSVGVHEEISALFTRLIDEVTNKEPAYELLSSALLTQLISFIARQLRLRKGDDGQSERTSPQIVESIQYIHGNFDKKISVKELAAKAHLSVTRFSDVFKQSVGVSPQTYIVQYRLDKACEMMRHTNLSIRQIALLVGMQDQLYFSRLFKKHQGITPSEYQAGTNRKT